VSQKLSVLRACRQALRPGGRIAFTTIQPTPGLQAEQRGEVNQLGPQEASVSSSYQSMLRTAGFAVISATDVTAEYRSTLRRWLDATNRHEASIREIIGNDTYEERSAQRKRDLQGVDDGLLSRFIYTAARSARQ
jgi:cyclopropane fatty-acyl-phospholipid synthase-like methyltransferase